MKVDKIKVLQVHDKYEVGGGVGGSVRYFSTVFPKLPESYQVTVCSLSREDKGSRLLRERGFKVLCIPKGKFDLTKVFDLLRILKSEKIDIMHSHAFSSASFCRLASLISGVPVVVQQHFCHSVPVYQRLADAVLGRVAVKVIAVSESVKRFMINKQFYKSDSIKVIYNGIDLESDAHKQDDQEQDNREQGNLEQGTKQAAKTEEPSSGRVSLSCISLKDEFNINPHDKIISVIGRLHYIKGQQILFAAIPEIIRDYPAITLLVVGEGELKSELESIAEEHGFGKKVKFIGFRDDIESIMEQSDVVVIPSLSDACPTVALEAMKCGCAIVASGVDGLVEILSDREDALLVPVSNTSELASGVLELLNNPALSLELGQQATVNVNRFSAQEAANSIAEIYDEICKTRSE